MVFYFLSSIIRTFSIKTHSPSRFSFEFVLVKLLDKNVMSCIVTVSRQCSLPWQKYPVYLHSVYNKSQSFPECFFMPSKTSTYTSSAHHGLNTVAVHRSIHCLPLILIVLCKSSHIRSRIIKSSAIKSMNCRTKTHALQSI